MSNHHHFDPLSPEFKKHPFEHLNAIREICPAYRHEESMQRTVSIFRNQDVRSIANNWQDWSSDRGAEYKKGNLGEATVIFYDDPPTHTKLRSVVAPLFLPARVQEMSNQITLRVEQVLNECLDMGEFDMIDDFAAKITVYMIAMLVGLPEDSFHNIRHWTHELEEFDGLPAFWSKPRPEVEAQVGAACQEMSEYFKSFIDERRNHHKGDVLSIMLEGGFSDREASGFLQLLIIAGQATTSNLIGNVFALLLQNPDQMALLRSNHEYIESTMEEGLRLHSQIRKLERIARKDCRVGDIDIKKGDFVALWLASAKRDPRVIDRPNMFDITRPKVPHVGFGTGIHMCIGNALARMETRVALKKFLEKTKSIDFSKGPEAISHGPNPMMDVILKLPVRVKAA